MCTLISAAAWTLLYLLDRNAETATYVIIWHVSSPITSAWEQVLVLLVLLAEASSQTPRGSTKIKHWHSYQKCLVV